tara:strand:- start:83436 stop:84263 length:828 start_codon:yes stop_codon:yes gene_type:complete
MGNFGYCLNTSTISSAELSPLEYIDLTAKTGYDGIELWVEDIDRWVALGGSLTQLNDFAKESDLEIVNLIAFFEWAVPEKDKQTRALVEAQRCFSIAEALDCPFVATAPQGIHNRKVDLYLVAERFAELNNLVSNFKAQPILEFWGVSQTLRTIGEILFVAAESGIDNSKILIDIFHMYKGTGHLNEISSIPPGHLGLVHVNDFPSYPSRASIKDEHRVYPGDGETNWPDFINSLDNNGYDGMLSIELFNPSYWKKNPLTIAENGLKKLKLCIEN